MVVSWLSLETGGRRSPTVRSLNLAISCHYPLGNLLSIQFRSDCPWLPSSRRVSLRRHSPIITTSFSVSWNTHQNLLIINYSPFIRIVGYSSLLLAPFLGANVLLFIHSFVLFRILFPFKTVNLLFTLNKINKFVYKPIPSEWRILIKTFFQDILFIFIFCT